MFQSLTDTYVSLSKTQHIHQHMQQIQSQYTDRFIVRDNNWNDMISYRTLINQAHRFKKALQHLPAQSLIAIHLPSSCDMAVAMMGCFFVLVVFGRYAARAEKEQARAAQAVSVSPDPRAAKRPRALSEGTVVTVETLASDVGELEDPLDAFFDHSPALFCEEAGDAPPPRPPSPGWLGGGCDAPAAKRLRAGAYASSHGAEEDAAP